MDNKKPNEVMAIRLTSEARTKLDSVIGHLKNHPPAIELGRPTIKSVISAAVIEGLDVLAARYGLDL